MENKGVSHYMVEFDLSLADLNELYHLAPQQQERVNELFLRGKIHTYSLSMIYDKLWAVFVVESESELVNLIESLPATTYLDYNYHELMFHQSLGVMPNYSLN